MKRLFALALAVALAVAGPARAGSIAVGAFGGMSYPVLQDDTGHGPLMGARLSVRVVPFVTLEPYYGSSSLADKVTSVAGTDYVRQGFDQKIWGVDLLLASSGPLAFYPVVGVGQTKLSRAAYDQTFTTYNAGAGLGLAVVPRLTFHVRGEANVVSDGQTSRKFASATAGLTYSLFGLP